MKFSPAIGECPLLHKPLGNLATSRPIIVFSQLSLLQRHSREPQDCELVSLIARVRRNSESLFQTNLCRRRLPGDPQARELVRSFSSDDGDGNENVKKPIDLLSKTSSLHVIFCTFVCRYCTTTTWRCLISRFTGDVNKGRRNFLSLSKLESSLQEINSKEICLH